MWKDKKYNGREVIMILSYGSVNYGTTTPTSDNDYKVFLMPTFDDIYSGKMFSSAVKIKGDDYEFHDIRKLPVLLYKANPSYVEILESKVKWIPEKYKSYYNYIKNNKYKLAKMNLMGYFKALNGILYQKLIAIEKDLPNSKENEGYKRKIKYGFDTKQLMHIIRLAMMRDEVFLNDINPLNVIDLDRKFGKHSRLHGLKDKLINLKENKDNLTKEQALIIGREYLDGLLNSTFYDENNNKLNLEEYLKTFKIDNITYEKLENMTKKLIKKHWK